MAEAEPRDTFVWKIEVKVMGAAIGFLLMLLVGLVGYVWNSEINSQKELWHEVGKLDKLVYFLAFKNGMTPQELDAGANAGPIADIPLAQGPTERPTPLPIAAEPK
jgi:hypothetical protein